MFKDVKTAQAWIESVQKFGPKYDLVRMENAVKMLKHPETKYPTIHVAGTNGKGSTVAFMSHILMAAQYKVGMYISPYIIQFNERFMIDHTPISDADLLRLINAVARFNETYQKAHQEHLSFFELTTLLAFIYFAEQNVDVAVIEVGIGGRLDATNVIQPDVTIITSIGFDHMDILGATLPEIAGEKLGIVKPGIPLVTAVNDASLVPLFKAKTAQMHAALHVIKSPVFKPRSPQTFTYRSIVYETTLLGAHQINNAACALEASYQLMAQGYRLDEAAMQAGIRSAFWPGRFELRGHFLLDGAHNTNALDSLIDALHAYYPSAAFTIVFGVMADKDSAPMQARLEALADTIIFTSVNHPRALNAAIMFARSAHPNKAIMTPKEVSQLKTFTVVAGSLYVVSAIRALIKEPRNA